MKLTHVVAATITLSIVFAILTTGVNYANGLERAYIHALAPLHPDIDVTGIALQTAAFSQPDLLPIYGASEELIQANEFQPVQFFKSYPTDFSPFETSQLGSTFVISAEAIAGVGSGLKGKKVVFSFTPDQFIGDPEQLTGLVGDPEMFSGQMMDSRSYERLFSRLDANELAFSSQLSLETKRLAANRMLQYPDTLKDDPLLKFALEQLASNTLYSHILYYLSSFLGKVQTAILELQDHYRAVTYIQSLTNSVPNIPHQRATIDWNAQLAKARLALLPLCNNNRFGFDNTAWKHFAKKPPGHGISSKNPGFIEAVNTSTGWADLELLLKISKELGAQPLLLGRPINAKYFHAIGVSEVDLQAYYAKLDQLAAQYGVPVVNFRNHEYDTYFDVDPLSHTSREGWVYVDQALDTFYHQSAH